MIYQPIPFKRCSKCHQWLPMTTKYFTKESRVKSGLRTICRNCRSLDDKRLDAKDPAKAQKRIDRWQQKHPDGRKEITRRYRENHPDRVKESHRRWNVDNIERIKITTHQWYINNIDRKKKTNKRWQQRNADEIKIKKHHYRKVNKERLEHQAHIRRARARGLPHTLTNKDWRNALKYWHGGCAYCGHSPSLFDYHLVLHREHFIAESKGGGYTPPNIVPGCPSCNFSKNDKDALEWLISKWGKTIGKRKYDAIVEYFKQVRQDK